MSSSSVAFETLRKWKNFNTVLRVTVPNEDRKSSPETTLYFSVLSVLESELMLSLVAETRPHDRIELDLDGAQFTLAGDGRALEVLLASGRRWSLTEVLPS